MQKFYQSINLLFVALFVLGFSNSLRAQHMYQDQNNPLKNTTKDNSCFEGVIKFMQVTAGDTLYYSYYIKNRQVRLDVLEIYNDNENVDSYMIFDLDGSKITAVKPSRKMFINVPPKPYIDSQDSQFQIIKSKNNKKINGYRCYQWRVRNKQQNTEIAYWVANDSFDFFEDFLKLWNRSEKHALYFLQIPDSKGFFPMLSEERTTLREDRMTLKVVDIAKQKLDEKMFLIPDDYKSYDH